MRRVRLAGCLALAAGLGVLSQRAAAQAPTIDTGTSAGPGSNVSSLGTMPGANVSTLGTSPGAGGSPYGTTAQPANPISGRPGPSIPRVTSTLSQPGGGPFALPSQAGIAPPAPSPVAEVPSMGYLSPRLRPEDEGPATGMNLDQAIETMVRNNLDLRSKFYELPQADADILSASLRANPIFYADSQLVPYGQYSNLRPGGPLQYDVNISIPFDPSLKRVARTRSAVHARRVLEAQYQDAVRLQIDNLYTAWVDVLQARLTLRYSEKSVQGWRTYLTKQEARFHNGEIREAEFNGTRIQNNTALLGLHESEAQYVKTKRALATLLNLAPEAAHGLEIHGSVRDTAPLPPEGQELIRIALDNRPDVVGFRLGIQRAQADVQLARANRFSDVYLLYQPYTFQNNQPFGLKSATSWALGITVPLPVFNRNQGGIKRAELNVTQTRQELEALMRQVITDVQQAEWEYQVSRQAVVHIERELLPPAQQVIEDQERRWLGGEVSQIDFIETLRGWNDTVKSFHDTLVRHRRAMLDLNTAVGVRLLP